MPEITKTTANRETGSMDAVGVLTADQGTLPKIQAAAESANYVEARPAVGLAPSAPTTPLSDKVKTIGDSRMAARKLDPDFENWKNQAFLPTEEEVNTLKQLKQMKVSKWDQIVKDATEQTEKDMKTVEKTTAAPRTFAKEAIFGVLDAANRGTQALIELHNAGANFFGVESLEQLPDLAEVLPEPTNEGEAFVRSSARFLAGFLPISRAVKGLAGVGGVVNSAVSSGLTGFIFDDEKTDGVVTEFLKENVSISEPVLKYLNHEIDDNQFQTRLKNAANFAVDDLLFEGLFAGFKALKYKSAAQEGAYRVLDNGDVEVTATKVGESDLPTRRKEITDNLNRFQGQGGVYGFRVGDMESGVPSDFNSSDFAYALEERKNNHWMVKTFDKMGYETFKRYLNIYENSTKEVQALMERDPKMVRRSEGKLVGGAIQNRLWNDVMKDTIEGTLGIKTGPKTKEMIANILEEDLAYIEKYKELSPNSGAMGKEADVLKFLDELNTQYKTTADMPDWAKDLIGYRDGVVKAIGGGKPVKDNRSLVEAASDFVKKVVSNDFRIAGLTTEESSKKPLSDILKEKYIEAEQAFKLQQDAKPDRKRISREQSMKAVTSSPEDMASLINRLSEENAPVNQEDVLKATLAQKALMDTADEVVSRFEKGELNEVVAFRQLDGISNMISTLSNPRSTAGRALEITKQAYEIMGDPKFDSASYKKMRDLYGRDMKTVLEEIRLNKEVMTGFSTADTLISAKRKVGGNLKNIAKYMQAARINWILSDPTTHAVNILSNTANLGLRVATQATARQITNVKTLVYGNPYKARGVQAGEATAMMRGYVKGMIDVASKINENIEVLTQDKSLYSPRYKALFEKDSNNKYVRELPFLEEDKAAAVNFADSPLHMKFARVTKDLVGGTPVGRLLSWEDDAFKGVIYASELEKEIHVRQEISRAKIVEMQSSGIAKEEIDAFAKSESDKFIKLREDMKKGIIPSDIEEKAIEAANVWTYNNINNDPDIVSRGLRASGEFINNMPFLKWFVPFFNTGSNILNQGVEYTPVLGTLAKAGNFGGVAGLLRGGKEADVFLAKQAIGGAVAASAAMFIANMEEQYGEDFSITSIKENKGGIKIGDTEIPLDKQNPILKLIIASRDVMDIANVAESDEGAGAAANALVTVLAEMYSPEQLINVLGAFGELNKSGREELPIVFKNMIKNNVLSSVSPYSGAARFVNRDILGMDKPEFGSEIPGFSGVVDEMMGRLKFTYLGDDAELPKKRGLFGQEIPYLRSFGFAVTNSAHSLFAGYSQDDVVVKELMKLSREDMIANPANYDNYILNDTAIFDMPAKSITLPSGSKYGELYKLSPKQYSEYVKYSADLEIQGVPTLKSALERVISSEEYRGIPNQFKIAQIKRIMGLYRKAAKAKIIADDPAILDEARATAMQILQEVGR